MSFPATYLPPAMLDRDRLITEHLPLLDFHVERMITQVPAFMTREEIASAATVGLIDAASRFDPGKGVLFKTFAEHRIRGAILDEVRRQDWFSRSLRGKQAQLSETVSRLEHTLGRPPEEAEIAAAMGMELEAYRQLLGEISHLGCVSLHEALEPDDEDGTCHLDHLADPDGKSPEQHFEARELSRELAGHLAALSEKERLVVSLYYYEELTQKEIAEVLGVTEGRVSQLHSQALVKLRARLRRPRRPWSRP